MTDMTSDVTPRDIKGDRATKENLTCANIVHIQQHGSLRFSR